MVKFTLTTVGILVLFGNSVFADSDLIVIKQDDAPDNTKGITYDCLDFLSRITINAKYFQHRTQLDCPHDCSGYKNSDFWYSSYYGFESIPKNAICQGYARDCLTYKAMPNNVDSYRMQMALDLSVGIFSKDRRDELRNLLIEKSWCPICRCYCDNTKKVNVTISVCLDAVSSNVEEEYVVTGARLIIVDRVLRIQIKEGKLFNGFIDDRIAQWKSLDGCTATKDMSYEYRSLQTDDIKLPEGYVVTGLAFRNNDTFNRIVFSVYGKQSEDLKNMNINVSEYWRPSDNRIDLMKPEMDNPTSAQKQNTELSVPDKNYVTFQLPSFRFDFEDDNNKLMPYIDIREVVSEIKPPRGVGIYWRGQEFFGGYVAIKLFVENNL